MLSSRPLNQSGQSMILIVMILVIIMLLVSAAVLAGSYTEFVSSFLDGSRRRSFQAAMAGIDDGKMKLTRDPSITGSFSISSSLLSTGSSATYTIGSCTEGWCTGAEAVVDSTGVYDSGNGSSTRRIQAALNITSVGVVTQIAFQEIQP